LTALAGGAIYIEHLDERWLTVEVLPGEVISPGESTDHPVTATSLTLHRRNQGHPRSRNAILPPPRLRQPLRAIRCQVPRTTHRSAR
jgi:DnaJ family protein A protein 2